MKIKIKKMIKSKIKIKSRKAGDEVFPTLNPNLALNHLLNLHLHLDLALLLFRTRASPPTQEILYTDLYNFSASCVIG